MATAKKRFGGMKCHCKWGDKCKELMERHLSDPDAPLIGDSQSFVTILKPDKMGGRKSRQKARGAEGKIRPKYPADGCGT